MFVAEGALPEAIVKQLLVIISLNEHKAMLSNIKGVVLSSPPDSNASLAQFATAFKVRTKSPDLLILLLIFARQDVELAFQRPREYIKFRANTPAGPVKSV